MLEPLSAIALASSIIQFVDFGSKILASGCETYHSTHGATEDNVDLESLTQSLYKFQDQLSTHPKQLTHNDRELQKLAQNCSYLAGDLLLLLGSFKVKEHGLIHAHGMLYGRAAGSFGTKMRLGRKRRCSTVLPDRSTLDYCI